MPVNQEEIHARRYGWSWVCHVKVSDCVSYTETVSWHLHPLLKTLDKQSQLVYVLGCARTIFWGYVLSRFNTDSFLVCSYFEQELILNKRRFLSVWWFWLYTYSRTSSVPSFGQNNEQTTAPVNSHVRDLAPDTREFTRECFSGCWHGQNLTGLLSTFKLAFSVLTFSCFISVRRFEVSTFKLGTGK